MSGDEVDDLLDQLIQGWSSWDTCRTYILETLAPAIVRFDRSTAKLTAREQHIVGRLRGLLTEDQWKDLPNLLDIRAAFLSEDRLRREEEARLRPIRQQEERERQKAEQEAAVRQRAEELRQFEEQRRREEVALMHRRQALLDRIMVVLETDFLRADHAYGNDVDRDLLGLAEYEAMRTAFVKDWAQRELNLDLDNEQAAAVATVGVNVRVTARAGSGKTRTLIARAIFLIRHCRVAPREMLLLAFNRQAAREMRHRLELVLDGEIPHVMTFHALAHALVHPEETLVFDNASGDTGSLSRMIQDVIDEHLNSEQFAATIKKIMIEHFREDWETIATDGFDLRMDDFLARRRAQLRETLGGEFVKSYGEKVIANALFEHGVAYGYERSRRWNGVNYRPDFTIPNPNGGGIVIEYFGLKGDPDYDEQAKAKRVYWSTAKGWSLLEYTPGDLANGPADFTRRLIADLSTCGFALERLSEEEIWGRVRDRAIYRFTGAIRDFVMRSRKHGLDDEKLRILIESHVPFTSAEEAFLRVGRSIHQRYVEKLSQTFQEDFDGLVWRAIKLVHAGSTRFARNQGRESGDVSQLRFLLIDEFQDFSPMFNELIAEIRRTAVNVQLFCVGDDWQAIYSFAGSDLRYFLSFDSYFCDSVSREIRTNYRSPALVVAVGNAVMNGRGSSAVAKRMDQGEVWVCDLARFEPTSIEAVRHEGDDLTPAVLRLVRHFIEIRQHVVLLSRQNRIRGYVRYGREQNRIPDELERFVEHVRSFLPEEDRKFVSIATTHEFKGREQAAVIVLDAMEGSYPLLHPGWVFLRVFGDTLDKIIDEERRLFYVAVTRSVNSLCLITESSRHSPFLRDVQRMCKLESAPWLRLPPTPSIDGLRIEVCVFDAFDVKDELKAQGYRWSSIHKCWSHSFPADSYSEAKLIAKSWFRGKVQVEVRSEGGRVIRPRSSNSSVN